MSTVYLNGEYLPKDEATVPVDDRGFLFADGVYEVTPAYRGAFFRMDGHLERMRRGLGELRIDFDPSGLPDMHRRLLAENGLEDEEVSIVYVQVTRGVAPRTHAFPTGRVEPTVYAFAKEYRRPARDAWEKGFEAVTHPDRRWARVDIKTIALLPNVLAQQAAAEAGVADALLVRDGMALEGAHNNFFAVFDGVVVTHPASNVILGGITRDYVLDLCGETGTPVEERPIHVEELAHAEEAFFTGTTTEIRPCVRIDGRPVGEGRVGPVARRLFQAFLEGVGREAAGAGVG
ncbi:MAG: aminotransferase class IV [Gemmatimonadetes bacterium]|nr:aminotransferase class IV [Gemmatimonadota bacterium]